jgi:fucose permease
MSNSIHRGFVFVAACAGMALFGMSLAIPGTVLGFPAIREQLHMSPQQQGLTTSLLLSGVWFSTLVVGPVIDRFGNKVVLALSSLLAAIGFGGFLAAIPLQSITMLAACVLVLGLGCGGLNTSANAAVSAIYDDKRATMLNLLGIFFGGGAFLLPTIAATLSPLAAVGFACGFAVICTIAYFSLRFPPAKEAHRFSLAQALKVIAYPGVLLFAAVFFCESANEQTMNSFSSTWLGAAGMAATRAAVIYSMYHLSMAAGRLLAVPLLKLVEKRTLVIASALGSICGTTLLIRSAAIHSTLLMAVGVILTGLSFAPIYPTMLGIVGDRYHRFAGTLFGILFSIALTGAIIAPTAVGLIAKRQSNILAGTVIPVIGTTLVLAFALLATKRTKSRVQQSEAGAAAESGARALESSGH